MKIVVLGLRGFPNIQGGVETHCKKLYPLIAAAGHEVIVIARSPYAGEKPYEYNGVKILPISCPRQKFLEAFAHTFFGLFTAKKLNPDILHIHAVGPAIMIPLARLMGFKVVLTHHGPDYERKKWNKFAKFILKTGECFGCRAANAVICIAPNIAADVKRKYGVDATVVPNGVAMPQILGTGEALNKYGLRKGKYLLSVGRFVPEKGFHDLIEAFSGAGLGNDWKLAIAGDADHQDAYSRDLKEKAQASAGVVLTGFLTGAPLAELYENAGLFVLPSYYEGLPIALLEALSYGLSCIVSGIPANRNVKMEDSRFFKPGDIAGLAAKIREFTAFPLSEAARREQLAMISAEYAWPKIAAQTLEVYRSLR